ncbi:unnamed protein product [Caenorhabditis bovis]|uniref:Uncharacterized protein n=1 Tax=Caenorhabditis bovis TaxID=2654633 RepID=A0A8S1F0V9_9PELO|nr:unnamed protein product [Caenorhabditis bovis]
MSSTFQLNELTEEIFGHLCNVALTKCSDKFEKKRAGCGGRAMRKRVLIKNFVSDLFKMPKKPASAEISDDEFDEFESAAGSTFFDEELDDVRIEDLHGYPSSSSGSSNDNNNTIPPPNEDCWLSQADVYSGHYEQASYGFEMDKSYPNAVPYSYDIYSMMSEQASDGELPQASDPLASISSLMHPTADALYGGVDMMADTRFYTNDDYFMTTSTEAATAYDELDRGETVELTDLDASTGQSQMSKKRRSADMYDEEFTNAFQKRIKI